LRAPTPTAAAELATPVTILDLKTNLAEIGRILINETGTIIQQRRDSMTWIESRMKTFSPLRRLQSERQRLDELNRRGNAAQIHRLELATERLNGLENQLEALSPMAVLRRGYAVVTKNKKVVASKSQVQEGDSLQVRVRDGEFDARVTGMDR
jgi:exodeoxyribonuclease VII large subunit